MCLSLVPLFIRLKVMGLPLTSRRNQAAPTFLSKAKSYTRAEAAAGNVFVVNFL